MGFFSRKAIQSMLDGVGLWLNAEKRIEILANLNSGDSKNIISHEIELAIFDTLQRVGHLEVEPKWWLSNNKPDGFSNDLIKDTQVIFEITVVTDGNFFKQINMEKIVAKISQHASTAARNFGLKKFGPNLFFSFERMSGYTNGQYESEIMAGGKFNLSETQKEEVKIWIENKVFETESLNLNENGTVVEVKYAPSLSNNSSRYFPSMSGQYYSYEKHPVWRALQRKGEQLKNDSCDALRVVVLVDGGTSLLEKLDGGGYFHWSGDQITGREVIEKYLEKYPTGIGSVVVLSAGKKSMYPLAGGNEIDCLLLPLSWQLEVFWSKGAMDVRRRSNNFERFRGNLPEPVTSSKDVQLRQINSSRRKKMPRYS